MRQRAGTIQEEGRHNSGRGQAQFRQRAGKIQAQAGIFIDCKIIHAGYNVDCEITQNRYTADCEITQNRYTADCYESQTRHKCRCRVNRNYKKMKYKTDETIFHRVQVPLAGGTSFPLLTFAAWEELPGIRHCFSTREGGVSEGWLSSLNLRRGLYDPDENVNENFRRIAGFFGVGPDRIVCAQQTHTSNVRIVTSADAGKGVTRERDYTDIDGLITDIPGIVLYTSHADCVPIYFYDPVRRVIALAHSGWKGTAARIGEVTIRKMQEIYGCRPEDIYAAVGPSICADCYEVSEDVADAMRTCFSEDGHETIPRILAKGKRSGHYQLDLWRACARILLESGIILEHLTISNVCTCENSDELFSHRATGGKRGNQGAFLMLT